MPLVEWKWSKYFGEVRRIFTGQSTLSQKLVRRNVALALLVYYKLAKQLSEGILDRIVIESQMLEFLMLAWYPLSVKIIDHIYFNLGKILSTMEN